MARRRKNTNVKTNDFNVVVASNLDDSTVLLTAADLANNAYDRVIRTALSTYDPTNTQYSAFLNETQSSETLTMSRINELAKSPQTNLSNTLVINSVVQEYINKDDLFGVTYNAISDNVNTEFKCSYKKYTDKRNKTKGVETAKAIINDFNKQINVEGILRSAIPGTFAEGTYIMYLRRKDENYVVDYYPLGVAEVSDYTANGRPIVLINISKLKSALSKTMLKDKKRNPIFFENQDEEIQNTYPDEVYEAFKNNETYAKLDPDHTGVVRINSMGRKYGLTPFFRALSPTLMLDTFRTADATNAKARAKKFIHQKLRKEVMGPQLDRKGFTEMVSAHSNLMSAWKQSTVVVTTPPSVESISYVEPKVEMTNIETINNYRSRVMAALGISFMNTDGNQTVSTANISLSQLMKNINKISEQIEDILEVWYRIVLEDSNIDAEYCPEVKISASEMMSIDMKRQISSYLYSTLGASRQTAFEMIGVSVEDELQRREFENENGYDDIFLPHDTSYNSSGSTSSSNSGSSSGGSKTGKSSQNGDGGKVGRPAGEATDKQAYDKMRNDAKKQQEGKG